MGYKRVYIVQIFWNAKTQIEVKETEIDREVRPLSRRATKCVVRCDEILL